LYYELVESEAMDEKQDRIILPEKLQVKILQFFLKTSIPRIKQKKDKAHRESPSEIKNR